MDRRLPNRTLHHDLQQLATAMRASNEQISDLQQALRRTRRKWTDEDQQHRAEIFELQSSSCKLISSCLRESQKSKLDPNHHVLDSIKTSQEPLSELQQNSPKILSQGSTAQVLYLHLT